MEEVLGHDREWVRFAAITSTTVAVAPVGELASLPQRALQRTFEHSALVVGDGVPEAWVMDPGVTIRGLSTHYGRPSYSMRGEGERVWIRLEQGLLVPPGGIVGPITAEPSGEIRHHRPGPCPCGGWTRRGGAPAPG
ncbi:MAG: hypothetical protein H0V43_13145 [Gemmatimonadales bacterium]|nr:hypothetical protein [Gemmatimonadales bacterium]MBA3554925.1 hypothetical protein [Gemmatimonadales bacterium]